MLSLKSQNHPFKSILSQPKKPLTFLPKQPHTSIPVLSKLPLAPWKRQKRIFSLPGDTIHCTATFLLQHPSPDFISLFHIPFVWNGNMSNLASLPPELVREVISYLPIASFLAFGLTSKEHHAIQCSSLSILRLGVFPSRLAGMISLMEAAADVSSIHSVQTVLPKAQTRTKDMIIRNQNALVQKVVDKHRQTLRDLEIALWDLKKPSARSVSRLVNLRRLSIRLDHPHTRHAKVDRDFWESSPVSTAWNSFFARPDERKVFGRLQSLNLERAGITDFQLRQILKNNPMMSDLRLRKCLVLTRETFEHLARDEINERLETLHFTWHGGYEIDDNVLDYIEKLPNLKVC